MKENIFLPFKSSFYSPLLSSPFFGRVSLGTEQYVFELSELRDVSFFPVQRALVLERENVSRYKQTKSSVLNSSQLEEQSPSMQAGFNSEGISESDKVQEVVDLLRSLDRRSLQTFSQALALLAQTNRMSTRSGEEFEEP